MKNNDKELIDPVWGSSSVPELKILNGYMGKIILENRISRALDIAKQNAQFDGADHKMWVIDQMIRCLLEDDYDKFIEDYCDGEDGPNSYSWDTGSPP